MSTTPIAIRRRTPRPTPFRSLRLGTAARSGAAATLAFPGFRFPEPEGRRRRAAATAASVGLHAAIAAGLVALIWFVPEAEPDKPIPIELLQEIPTPVAHDEPAPAPKALAERRNVNFAPSAQTVTPEVVNPTVVARAAPRLDAKSLAVQNLQASVTAPREIQRSSVAVEAVQAVTSVAAAAPTQVDVSVAAAPALRGPAQALAPSGASVGPKAIADSPSAGASIGTGPTVVSGDGSSVREGMVSNRDVLGSADGPRLANVNTRVGQSNLRGSGGEGTTLGGVAPDCERRAEVMAYLGALKDRTVARWVPPPDAPAGNMRATLRFQLDVGGSATRVELVSAQNPKLGATVVDALRSASPFPPMSDRVRCLAGQAITGTFSLQTTSQSATLAN